MTSLTTVLRGAVRSPFLRAVGLLSGGQSVAILIPILAAPVLGRLYPPAEYGALAQVMAPAAVLGVVATLQFQHAIIAERSDRTAGAVAWLCILTAFLIGSIVALGVAALWSPVLAGSAAGAWFALLPLTVTGAGLTVAGGVLANRHQRYRWLAGLQIAHVATTVAASILLGLLSWGADGLLSAYFLGQVVQFGANVWLLSQFGRAFSFPPPVRLYALIRRHWKFPAFTMPGEFLGQLNMQAPIFALSALGADATLGAFARARQLVSMPVTILGGAVAQVFRREAAELYRTTGSCRGLMLRTAGGLLAAGFGPCLLFTAFAPWLFTVYLGPDWQEAGEIARILAPMLLLRVIVSPLATVFYFTERQLLDLILTICSAVIMLLFMAEALIISGTATAVIWGFTLSYSLVYALYTAISILVSSR